jgi:hypothetical protein
MKKASRIFLNFVLLVPIGLRMAYKVLLALTFRDYAVLKNSVQQVVAREGALLPSFYAKRFRLYAIMGTVLVEWYALLLGRGFTENQRHITMYLCAITPVFDDLIDEYAYEEEDVYRLCNRQAKEGNILEMLCLHFYEELKKRTNKEILNPYFQKVLDYQLRSRAQINGTLSDELLREIMYAKGGYSVLYFKSISDDNGVQAHEERAFFNIGALIQYTNDLFDVHKDLQANIQTLPNKAFDIPTLRADFEHFLRETIVLCYQLPYSRLRIRCFLLSCMIIYSRALVCFDQFEALQKKSNNVFTPQDYPRKWLICDMEKIKNLWSSFMYMLNYF